jgi:hypothetical protein
MSENSNPIEEIEKEIEETRRKAKSENFEIEVTDEKEVEAQAETQSEEVKKPLKVKRKKTNSIVKQCKLDLIKCLLKGDKQNFKLKNIKKKLLH